MSFIPDLHNMTWVSVVATIMSFTYSFIGLGLGFAQVISKFILFLHFKPSKLFKATKREREREREREVSGYYMIFL